MRSGVEPPGLICMMDGDQHSPPSAAYARLSAMTLGKCFRGTANSASSKVNEGDFFNELACSTALIRSKTRGSKKQLPAAGIPVVGDAGLSQAAPCKHGNHVDVNETLQGLVC